MIDQEIVVAFSKERKNKNGYIRGCSGKGNWQNLWILLDKNRSKIRIGVIYAPQENVTSKNELKVMCNNISKQISIAQEERQQVLILGDFNTKVGTYIKVTNQQWQKGRNKWWKWQKIWFGNNKQRKGSM